MDFCQINSINLNVINKAHSLWVHVPQFLDGLAKKNMGDLGMGVFSTQPSESVHYDFNSNYWEGGRRFKLSMDHENYSQNFFNCNVVFDSEHEGSKPTTK